MVTEAFSDFVVGHGELWSARLFSLYIQQKGVDCRFMDTREVLVVTSPDGKVVDVEYGESDYKLDVWSQRQGVPDVSPSYFHSSCTIAHTFDIHAPETF